MILKFPAMVLASLLLFGGSAAANEGGGAERVLALLAEQGPAVSSLASGFVQEKHLSIFQETLTSKGRFYFQSPDRLRWEMTEPVTSGFLLAGGKGRRWHQRAAGSESFDIEREPAMKLIAEQLFAWAKVDLPLLREQYRMTLLAEEPVTLRLEPLAPGSERFLDHLQIVFASDRRHVDTVEVHEKDGDYTRIRFVDTVVDGPVDDTLFRGE